MEEEKKAKDEGRMGEMGGRGRGGGERLAASLSV